MLQTAPGSGHGDAAAWAVVALAAKAMLATISEARKVVCPMSPLVDSLGARKGRIR
jgi:hypothetical protein